MTWILILFLVIVFTFPRVEQPHILYRYRIRDLEVIICSQKMVNTWWRMTGGQRYWRKVHAFSYYDHREDKYYIILPPNPNERLIGHEFKHILDWEKEKIREYKIK